LDRNTRNLSQTKANKPVVLSKFPAKNFGNDGDVAFIRTGTSLSQAIKNNGKWIIVGAGSQSSTKGKSADAPKTIIVNSGSSGTINTAGAVMQNGSTPFTTVQTGVGPTSDLHLATKKYVDDTASNTSWTISDGSTTQPIIGGNTLTVSDGTAINAVVSATDTLTIHNTGVTSNVAGAGIGVSSGTGAVTITNSGVTSNVAGTGIGVSSGTGAVTITNSGVTGITGGTAIDASASTGSVTLSVTADSIGDTQLAYNTGQHLTTSSAVTFATIDTGQGANELYDMNQNVLTSSDVTFNDIIVAGDDIRSDPFSSGFTGSGWSIDNTGHLEVSDATIRGTLSVYELLIQQIRASNGAIFVSSSAKVESSSGLSASDDDGTITFEDPSNNNLCPFAANDLIMMQRIKPGAFVAKDAAGGATNVIKKLVYKVASVNGKTITVENGGFDNTSSPSEGDDFVRIGNTSNSARQGIVYLTSDDSNSPYIDIKADIDSYSDWTSSTAKVRLGKLDGITYDSSSLSGFGLYSENVYLTGKITATSGAVGGWSIANDILSSGNLRIDGSNNVIKEVNGKWSLNNDGSASFADGNITFATNGDITSQTYLIERSRLFGDGSDSYNGSSYIDTEITTSSRTSAYGEFTYAINMPPSNATETSSGYGTRIMARTGTKWYMQNDGYFKNFTVKSGTILYTMGYKLFCNGTLTIESGASIQNNGSTASSTRTGASGGAGGTLHAGASGKNGGLGGDGTSGSSNKGGFGGGAGGSGGIVLISARYVSNSGSINATGGNGSNGEAGTSV
tara:strand:- start:8 stop:2383 length:2376 start_codon:yes stop_codon:yes gene_type:complete